MTSLSELSNIELIDFVYSDLAGQKIRDSFTDFSDSKYWRQIVDTMNAPVSLAYRIGILNRQVMNGGFIQYFDNGYGIFAIETLNDLKTIHANLTYDLLHRCLGIINPSNYVGDRFVDYVFNQEYDPEFDTIVSKLDPLDKEYWQIDTKENLESLVGNYLRQHLSEVE